MDRSDQLPPIVERRTRGGKGFEAFYNIEATPWLHVTPDLQVLEPALQHIDTDVILGVRAMIEF